MQGGDFLELCQESYDLNGTSWAGLDISNENLREINFGCASFDSCTFRSVNFLDCYFDFVELVDCTFINCSLRGASFDSASASGTLFQGCDINNAEFDGAQLTGARFIGCYGAAVFSSALLDGAIFDVCDLTKSTFYRADLDNSQFTYCLLENVNVNYETRAWAASFEDCDLTDTSLKYVAGFTSIDLKGITISPYLLGSSFVKEMNGVTKKVEEKVNFSTYTSRSKVAILTCSNLELFRSVQ